MEEYLVGYVADVWDDNYKVISTNMVSSEIMFVDMGQIWGTLGLKSYFEDKLQKDYPSLGHVTVISWSKI